MMEFACKLFRTGGDTLLAIADAPLVGRRLKDGRFDIVVSEEFYRGSVCSEGEAKRLARSATIINAIGENAVAMLAEMKIVDKDNVLVISGVPHAQAVVVPSR